MPESFRRNSLWIRLMGAFLLVIMLGAIVDAILTSQATRAQFNRYVTQNGQMFAQQLAPAVIAYYARTGSWRGVAAVLQAPWAGMVMGEIANSPGWGNGSDMGNMMGGAGNSPSWGNWSGMGNRTGSTEGSWSPGMMQANPWSMMDVRLLLADEHGTVIGDTLSTDVGDSLSPANLAAGYPLQLENRRIGTLVAVSVQANVASPGNDFLKATYTTTGLASLAAAALALVVGSLLFRHIVAPIRAVTAAARRIAAGELKQRIPVNSADEVGQLASTFNQMADALSHDQQLRQNMIVDIAHELRTPLSILQGNLEAMLDGLLPASPPEIASLHDETTLLARLVADLRLLSLAEAGQLSLECAETDLDSLINRALDSMRPQAEAAGVQLDVDLSPHLPQISVDADRVSQVVRNLVSNALRYAPAGGRICVRVFPERTAAPTGPAVAVEVTDTGSGIAPEDLPHIFDRFYRADKSRSRASGGSGIGLAIVKHLVEAHGGRIRVESPAFDRPDQATPGTRFTFTLPLQARSLAVKH